VLRTASLDPLQVFTFLTRLIKQNIFYLRKALLNSLIQPKTKRHDKVSHVC
jgi:hypothetical protein